ncbi:hypothetical protein C4552_04420 [Candidatus Parcubacteria bacterium]|nr:MAG: hypothetical protein C4552_04420 [Candidatus Parcubacteria bacterium]
MATAQPATQLHIPERLQRRLVLDELFDLTLYQRLRAFASADTARMLDALIPVETGHLRFWQQFFGIREAKLDMRRRMQLGVMVLVARVFGERGIHLVLQAIEVYGVKKYLDVWDAYRGGPLGEAVRGILIDEFKHEDDIVTEAAARKLHPERVRDIFLGFNDGMVEILGAVSGFFAAFPATSTVLVASATVAVAGSISMAAGAFAALSSEREIERIEERRKQFLGTAGNGPKKSHPLASGAVVGIFYFIGAMVPVVPVLFGAESLTVSIIAATVVVVIVSYILAFLSGMSVARRIGLNLVIIAIAVGVTYTIGSIANRVWGLAL